MARPTGLEPVTPGLEGASIGIAGVLKPSQSSMILTDPGADAGQRPRPFTDFSKDFATEFATEFPRPVFDLDEPFLTVREVASRLSVSTATVYDLIADGRIDHYRVKNAIRIPLSALTRFIAGPACK